MEADNVVGSRFALGVEVRVRGYLDADWSSRFHGLSISHTPGGETVLTGHIRDQPELRGLLSWLADLGLELMSVTAEPVRGPPP